MNITVSSKLGRFIRWYCNVWLASMVHYLHHGNSSPRGLSYLAAEAHLSPLASAAPDPTSRRRRRSPHTHHPPHDSQQPTPTHRRHSRSRGDPPAAPLSTPPACHPRHGRSVRGGRRGGDGPTAHGLWCAAGPNSPLRSLPVTTPRLSRPRRRATTSKNRGGTPLRCKSLSLLPVSCRCLR
jgi:hypothetical protein